MRRILLYNTVNASIHADDILIWDRYQARCSRNPYEPTRKHMWHKIPPLPTGTRSIHYTVFDADIERNAGLRYQGTKILVRLTIDTDKLFVIAKGKKVIPAPIFAGTDGMVEFDLNDPKVFGLVIETIYNFLFQ